MKRFALLVAAIVLVFLLVSDAVSALSFTVFWPEGTYVVSSPVKLVGGVVYRGYGSGIIPTIYMKAQGTNTYIFQGGGHEYTELRDLRFKSDGPSSLVSGVYMPGAQECTVDNLSFGGLDTGLKLGPGLLDPVTSVVSSGWVVRAVIATDCANPLYVSRITNASFSQLILDRVAGRDGIYIGEFSSGLWFDNWSVNMADGATGVCVKFANVESIPQDIAMEVFVGTGGGAFVGVVDPLGSDFQNVVFHTGVYEGPKLGAVNMGAYPGPVFSIVWHTVSFNGERIDSDDIGSILGSL